MTDFTANFTLTELETIQAEFVITSAPNKTSQLTNDNGFITNSEETDPIFTASPAASVNNTDISNWDIAYADSHTHSNKSILDATTASFTDTNYVHTDNNLTNALISTWDDKQDSLGYTPENVANKNTNNGYCGLDGGGKVPLTNLPATLLKYIGVWNASTNTPTLTSPDTSKVGYVYNVSVAGTQFGIDFSLGDWLIYNSSGVVEKSDNSNDVTSVNGQTGTVVLTKSDVGLSNVDNTSDANKPISTATQTALNLKANSSDLATVAKSGSYNDLTNKPTIPTVPTKTSQLQNDSNFIADSSYNHTDNNYTTAEKTKLAELAELKSGFIINNMLSDDFSSNCAQFDIPSYGYGVYTISNGQLLASVGTSGNYLSSILRARYSKLKNLIIKAAVLPAGSLTPQIHVRELAAQDNLIGYYNNDGIPTIMINRNGAQISINKGTAFPSYLATNSYFLLLKIFENYISLDLMDSNQNAGASVEIVSSEINLHTCGDWGLGSGNSSSIAYDTLYHEKIDSFLNVLCVGDSNTFGQNLTGLQTYTNKLKTLARNYPIGFINKGVCGDTVPLITDRLGTDILNNRVAMAYGNIVTLMVGTNDISIGETPDVVYNNYMTLVQKIQKFGFKVWAITYPPRTDYPVTEANLEIFNNYLRASTVPDKILDFNALCKDTNGNIISSYLQSDGKHLTDAGTTVLRDLIWNAVKVEIGIS